MTLTSPSASPVTGAQVGGPAAVVVRIRRSQAVMGTVVSYNVVPTGDRAAAFVGLARARAEMERIDRRFSLWRPDSPMSRWRAGEPVDRRAEAEIGAVLERCRRARDLSAGWFDPWALPGGVDPTGLVKGWAAGRALDHLVAAGVASAMVNAGGDIAVSGLSPSGGRWRVGIRHPEDPTRLLGVVEAEAAVATSGTYERGAHVLDPRQGRPAVDVVAATVTGPELDLADAFATALVAAGPEAPAVAAGLASAGYESLVVTGAGDMQATSGWRWAD